jgi:signal transduction protein with GAF and PtsI domain
MSLASHPLLASIKELMNTTPLPWHDVLEKLTAHFDCPVGTVHMIEASDGMLHLRAQKGLPPFVLDKVQVIPVGKGMAGIAAERKEPVQVCNLQTDDSGVARPSAKMTQMEGSLAAPMMVGGEVRGVLGVAKPTAYDFSSDETELLMAAGSLLANS